MRSRIRRNSKRYGPFVTMLSGSGPLQRAVRLDAPLVDRARAGRIRAAPASTAWAPRARSRPCNRRTRGIRPRRSRACSCLHGSWSPERQTDRRRGNAARFRRLATTNVRHSEELLACRRAPPSWRRGRSRSARARPKSTSPRAWAERAVGARRAARPRPGHPVPRRAPRGCSASRSPRTTPGTRTRRAFAGRGTAACCRRCREP